MKYVYAVTITLVGDARVENLQGVRAFTQRADAETFIATCREVDDRDCWVYTIHQMDLDGDPKGTF